MSVLLSSPEKRGAGTSSSTEDIDVLVLLKRSIDEGGEYWADEKPIDDPAGGWPFAGKGISRGGDAVETSLICDCEEDGVESAEETTTVGASGGVGLL